MLLLQPSRPSLLLAHWACLLRRSHQVRHHRLNQPRCIIHMQPMPRIWQCVQLERARLAAFTAFSVFLHSLLQPCHDGCWPAVRLASTHKVQLTARRRCVQQVPVVRHPARIRTACSYGFRSMIYVPAATCCGSVSPASKDADAHVLHIVATNLPPHQIWQPHGYSSDLNILNTGQCVMYGIR